MLSWPLLFLTGLLFFRVEGPWWYSRIPQLVWFLIALNHWHVLFTSLTSHFKKNFQCISPGFWHLHIYGLVSCILGSRTWENTHILESVKTGFKSQLRYFHEVEWPLSKTSNFSKPIYIHELEIKKSKTSNIYLWCPFLCCCADHYTNAEAKYK